MASRLIDNIDSRYFEAANALRGKSARRRIVAYVESYDDIYFWRTVLSRFENEKRYFEVMLPSKMNLTRGKKSVLMNFVGEHVGPDMIACVDADFDYLMQGATEQSRRVINSPYVFHTYVYAIENYQCYAPSLHQAVVTATLNDRPTLNFEAFLQEYSQIIWPLFLWNIWGYLHEDYKGFTMMDFCGFISFRDINPYHPEIAMSMVRRRVNQKIAWMQQQHPDAKKSYARVKQQMRDLGVTPETTYLYIQGHTLFENVVMPLLEPVCNMLRKEREREIKQLAVHNQQRQCELSSYQHSVMPIDIVLKKNADFKDAPPFQLVREAIQRVVEMNTPQTTTPNESTTTPVAGSTAPDGSTDSPAASPRHDSTDSL